MWTPRKFAKSTKIQYSVRKKYNVEISRNCERVLNEIYLINNFRHSSQIIVGASTLKFHSVYTLSLIISIMPIRCTVTPARFRHLNLSQINDKSINQILKPISSSTDDVREVNQLDYYISSWLLGDWTTCKVLSSLFRRFLCRLPDLPSIRLNKFLQLQFNSIQPSELF